jgi:hypothetical protein
MIIWNNHGVLHLTKIKIINDKMKTLLICRQHILNKLLCHCDLSLRAEQSKTK